MRATIGLEGPVAHDLVDAKPLADTEILEHYEQRVDEAGDFCRPIWECAEENERVVRGGEHQWEEGDYQVRKREGRPTFTMNDTVLAVNAISGRQITQRFEPAFVGRSGREDQGWADAVSEFSRKIRDRNDYEQTLSNAFRKLHIQSYAWLERYQDLAQRPLGLGQTVMKSVRIWEMIWDRYCRDQNLVDREWDACGRFVSYEQAIATFPGKERQLRELHANDKQWLQERDIVAHRWPWLYVGKSRRYVHRERKEVFLVDYCWRQRSFWYVVMAPPDGFPAYERILELWRAGAFSGLTPKDFKAYSELIRQGDEARAMGAEEGPPLELNKEQFRAHRALWAETFGVEMGREEYEPVPQWEFWRATIVGREILDKHPLPYSAFPRLCMTGFPFEQADETTHYCVVDLMKDPQAFKNMVFSMGVALLQHSPKGPGFYEPDAFAKPKTIASDLTKAGAMIPLKSGGLKKIDWGPQPEYMPGLDRFMDHADSAVWRPIGLSPSSLGQIPDLRRVSGEVFSRVQDAVSMILSYPFDSLRLCTKMNGRLDLAFMDAYYSHDQVRRIIGDEKTYGPPPSAEKIEAAGVNGMPPPEYPPPESEWLLPPKAEWQALAEFDVIVEEKPTSMSEMRETWDYFTRTAMLEKWVEADLIPLEIVVGWVPSISERDKRLWMKHLDKKRAQQEAAAAMEAEGGAVQ